MDFGRRKGGGRMKNGKVPTLGQKKIIKSHGLDPGEHLVVKDTPEYMEVVSRIALKKQAVTGKRPRTRKLYREGRCVV